MYTEPVMVKYTQVLLKITDLRFKSDSYGILENTNSMQSCIAQVYLPVTKKKIIPYVIPYVMP